MKKWKDLSNNGKLTRLALICGIIALLFFFPLTRAAILFVLPLGSGIDDLIFIACAILATVFFVFKMATEK